MELENIIAYIQRIFRGATLKNYREVLVAYSQLAKELMGDEWTLGKLAGLPAEAFWNWSNTGTMGYDVHVYLALDKCVNFEKDIRF